jgi:type IV pilus assembly protein PilV
MAAEMIRTVRSQKGVMLLEVMIALLIFSIGVVGMVMMQSVASSNSTNSEDRATAAMLANDLISDLWTRFNPSVPTAPTLPPDYAAWKTRVAAALPVDAAATWGLAITGNTAKVTIIWIPKGRKNSSGNTTYDNSDATYITQSVIQ